MGKTFKNVVISVTGEFGPKADKFKQWTEANGGKYSKEVDNGVTHLLATQEAFKKANSAVRAAKRIKGIKIVSSDWLEDSLLSKSRCPKREGPYLWARTAKNAKKKAAKERASKGSKSSGQKKGPEDKPKQKQKKNQELGEIALALKRL
ncbi:hypothetical protein FQN49_002818 [Arthroderma sp. PD_2]|nr:hypothetical protein FQN49_002818 [Arthroderma sp. PD_2]